MSQSVTLIFILACAMFQCTIMSYNTIFILTCAIFQPINTTRNRSGFATLNGGELSLLFDAFFIYKNNRRFSDIK